MQEIIRLVSAIRKDIEDLSSLVSRLTLTHAQRISEEWLTSDQAMHTLKISLSTLKILRRRGLLPYSKINGVLYFRTIDIENLLKQTYINPSAKDKPSSLNPKPHE